MIRAALLAVAVALGGLLAVQWKDWPPPRPGAELAVVPAGSGADNSDDPDPLSRMVAPEPREAYASVVERPLFRPQRRPPDPEESEPESEAASAESGSLKDMDLTAVVIAPGVVSAWVRDSKAQELKRVRLGDDLEGWEVTAIENERVVLEREGERDELVLRDFANAPPGPPVRPTPNRASPPGKARRPTGGSSVRTPVEPQDVRPVAPPRPPVGRPNVRRPLQSRAPSGSVPGRP